MVPKEKLVKSSLIKLSLMTQDDKSRLSRAPVNKGQQVVILRAAESA